MTRLDVVWMGREPRPIVVKAAKDISKAHRWPLTRQGAAVAIAVAIFLLVAVAWMVAT